MTDMLAYHNNPELKAGIMEQIRAHRLADEIAQGAYYAANGTVKACAVGCVLHDPEGGHQRYESEFGIPAQLAYLEDGLFESMSPEAALAWPERFMGAIAPGADLSGVWPRFAIWLMVDEKWGVVGATDDAEVQSICRRVAEGYRRALDSDPLSDEDAAALTWDARAARAARAIWAARAARAAWGAAWAIRAAWDARDARAAWAAWAARDTRDAFVTASADYLIELLEGERPLPDPSARRGTLNTCFTSFSSRS
jgi:hypothetical protein